MSAVTQANDFGPANTSDKLFAVRAGVPLVDALESAACLLDSAARELASLIEHCSDDQAACARLNLIKHAIQAAEAITWSASECEALNGGAV